MMTMQAFVDDDYGLIVTVERTEFDWDLIRDYAGVAYGHDPRNHIGADVILEIVGVDNGITRTVKSQAGTTACCA